MTDNLIKCKVWTNTSNIDFVYPETQLDELKTKLDIGISMSGGGLRAANLSSGWICGLNELKLMSKIKYISSVSGSSWFNVVYSYQNTNDNYFLDNYILPNELTTTNLVNFSPTSWAQTLVNANFDNELIFSRTINNIFCNNLRDPWTNTIAKSFNSSLTSNLSENPLNILPSLSNYTEKFQCYDYANYNFNSPFIIVNASLCVGDDHKFVPIEFTPMYYGLPIQYSYLNTDQKFSVGNYLIEPLGFTLNTISTHIMHENDNYKEFLINKPNEILSVVSQSAISSNAVGEVLSVIKNNKIISDIEKSIDSDPNTSYTLASKFVDKSNPQWNCWNPITNYVSQNSYIDGGASDNLGILSLVRRGVKNIISFFANLYDITDPNFNDISYCGELAALFGNCVAKSPHNIYQNISIDEYNSQRQIFSQNLWKQVYNGLIAKQLDGGPLTYLLSAKIQPNPSINIYHDYDIKILFILNTRSHKWINSLSPTIKKLVPQNFPFISTLKLSYSPELIGLMKQLSAWQIINSEKEINELIK